MLAKKYRLPVHKIFKIRGRTSGNSYFSVKITGNTLGFNRFGAVIGAKVSKKAVVRNKLRRLIFNTVRQNYKNMESPSGLDVLIIMKPAAVNLSEQEIKNLIIGALQRYVQ